ncbi:DUF3726 domain-containing protein [Leisingera aquimarina]|uniref:DUF3726 domain-containing protein n=1 Tax=Leisingera aquimarina TaxID=476529 RepID=UPI00041BA10A|nr:DUF3726 domain-containing protein [Leisingera aquimarina]
MNHSLNEIEAMCKRAARGAGLSWGLAEEAAKGTRWLSSFGFPGAELLAALLELNDRLPPADFAPSALTGVWSAPSGRMSPLIAGAALSDCAVQLMDAGRIEMERVCVPLLLVPFAAGAALRLETPVAVEWAGVYLATDGRQLCARGAPDAYTAMLADKVAFSTPAEMTDRREPVLRGSAPAEAWDRLGVLAHRTYAPATEASRLRGAGAGLSDND